MPNRANSVLSSLVENGKTLAKSLDEAKTGPTKEKLKQIHDVVSNILEQLQDVQQLPAVFRENAIPKILDKILASLPQFKEIDTENALDYDRLVQEINDRQSQVKAAAVRSSSPSSGQSPTGDSTSRADEDYPAKEQFTASLSSDERKCLFCFCLFPDGAEVKKREPIHLWAAMGLINDDDDDDRVSGATMLANLVARRYIDLTIRNRYKMNQRVRSMVIDAMNINFAADAADPADPTIYVMDQKQPPPLAQGQQEQQQPRVQPTKSKKDGSVIDGLGTLVLNNRVGTLQATTFQKIEKKSDIKVLHLGSWLHDTDRYITVEVETLKGMMKHKGEMKFLSLEGISGIIELPNYVYKLESLKVLDLRGCPNLESLSEGIESLKQLTHLDLSECYLLDGIPMGIASLTELRVLKGFIINPPKVGNGDGNEKKKGTCASFSELKTLKKLVKLTIRTRRRNFPTVDDFDTLNAMNKLITLRVAWVSNSTDDPIAVGSRRLGFPASLKKLVLQAASYNTMLRLLGLISNDSQTSLEELYIRGGRLRRLGSEMPVIRHVQTVRLKYLINLCIDWDEFRKFFPNITRLEVRECPKLIFFPCDGNGVWEKTSTK